MATTAHKPLIDRDGAARTPTDEEWLWAVASEDFASPLEIHDFLMKRKAFLRAAAAVGIERAAFLSMQPGKPGFLDRAIAALETLLAQSKHAAE